jgi:hypothetical protein
MRRGGVRKQNASKRFKKVFLPDLLRINWFRRGGLPLLLCPDFHTVPKGDGGRHNVALYTFQKSVFPICAARRKGLFGQEY